MATATEFRLLMSPLSRNVYAGKVKNRGGGNFESTGSRHDVTNDFLGVLIQYADTHKGEFEIKGGGEVWDVTVTKRSV